MNIDRFSLFLQRSRLLNSLIAGAILVGLTACGGGGGGKSNPSSSSSSISSSSSYSAASVPANGSGIWPSVKVTGTRAKTLTFEWSAVDGATSYQLMKNKGGNTEYVQVGDTVTSPSATISVSVHLQDWINDVYKVVACNGTDCEDSGVIYTATEMIKTIGYVKASNTDEGDFFGWSIALSGDGNTLAVGAPAEDSNSRGLEDDQASNTSDNSGAVYIFIKDAQGYWVQQAYLKASNTEQPNLNTARFLPNDRFGYRVALSDDGNTLAVTALLEDSPSYGINCNQDNYEVTTTISSDGSSSSDPVNTYIKANTYDLGAVYVFKRINTSWEQKAYVKPRTSLGHLTIAEGMRFGESLALSGDGKTLAVGASTDSLPLKGAVTYSSISSYACYEYYPSSMSSFSSSSIKSSSLSSSSVSSGASSSIPGGSLSGAIYMYIEGENGWVEEGYIKASNAAPGDAFGSSVDLSTDGNTMVVGAIGEDSIATGVNGDENDNSCFYIKDDAYTLDPACADNKSHPRLDNGAVYVFTRTDKTWAQQAYLKPAAPYIKTAFGYSVSLSGNGNTLAVGAIGDASTATGVGADPTKIDFEYYGSGAVYIFSRSGTTWSQQSYIKLERNIQGKEFGTSVSLSQDGDTLAAGSFRDSSNAVGINGDEGSTAAERAGAVFVYQRKDGAWSKISFVKSSNTDVDDRFGLNVDLSADGTTMAVGAHRESSDSVGVGNDQSNNDAEASGAVYLY